MKHPKRHLLIAIIAISIAIGLIFLIPNQLNLAWDSEAYEREVNNSLYNHTPYGFGGHPWYIAPMKGKTVQLYNGSLYQVHSDYWDGCEHNPSQGHLIGIGSYNQTALNERIQLDMNFSTRNYTATHALIIWINATQVQSVK